VVSVNQSSSAIPLKMSTASTGDAVYGRALTIEYRAPDAGLRINQDGRFLKGDFAEVSSPAEHRGLRVRSGYPCTGWQVALWRCDEGEGAHSLQANMVSAHHAG
jgi:hypothetical protein